MQQLHARLKNFHLHFLLLLIFFIVNGYKDYVGLIPATDILFFSGAVAAVSLILFFILKRFTSSPARAGLIVTGSLFVFLFYGVVQDGLQQWAAFVRMSRDRWLLPSLMVVLIIYCWLILRNGKKLPRFIAFLNTLLLIWILVDAATIAVRISRSGDTATNSSVTVKQACDTCVKPNMYLIVLDEYAGSRLLKEYFHYNNSHFEKLLRSRGFFVASTPSSNYSYTPLSLSSTFEMNYLDRDFGSQTPGAKDYAIAAKEISDSEVLRLLKQSYGYDIVNNSIFDLLDQPSDFDAGFFSTKMQLITSKTILNRIRKSLFWGVQVRGLNNYGWLGMNGKKIIGRGNERMIERTIIAPRRDKPVFTYTHLMMPHLPYIYDSTGGEVANNLSMESSQGAKDAAYVQYLSYTNKRMIELVDEIIKKELGRAVILLMSDHGYRDFTNGYQKLPMNVNFSAVYIPDKKYDGYYDSITNVNQFRVLFNTLFEARLPLLKDSVVY